MKRQYDRLMRERDAARLKGRLLRKQLQVAQRELETICAMLEEQKIHHKKDIAYLLSSSDTLFSSDRSTETLFSSDRTTETTRTHVMESLVGKSHSVQLTKMEDCQESIVGDYTFGILLGKGSFGRVYCGTHIFDKKEYAIKVFDKKVIKTISQIMNIEKEIVVMKLAVQHPNIVELHEVVHSSSSICLVMELGHMDLYSWVKYHRSTGHDMDPRVCREIILGLTKAIKHLHQIGIAHLDVKEDNILISKEVSIDNLTQEHVKLCDFGLCKISVVGEAQGFAGTRGYFAPEIVSGNNYNAQAADMFSVGCTLLSLINIVPKDWLTAYQLCKKSKTAFQNRMRVLCLLLQCDDSYMGSIAIPIVQIVRGLLIYEPEGRLTAANVLSHRWLAE
jgi:serine/threonine protein kinase